MEDIKVNFQEKEKEIHEIARRCFEYITNLPEGIRPPDKIRTGIQVYIDQEDTDNMAYFPVYEPSTRAKTFAVKKVLCMEFFGDTSSQNSENPEKLRFRGGLKVKIGNIYVRIGVSGLFGDEDVATGIVILAYVFNTSPGSIGGNIVDSKGMLPEGLMENHYLKEMFTRKKFKELTSFE